MKRTTKYVALDVHQATTVVSVREESGRVIARSILPTEEAAILEFLKGMRGAIHVTFEEGGQTPGCKPPAVDPDVGPDDGCLTANNCRFLLFPGAEARGTHPVSA